MKILIVNTLYPPNVLGGAELSVQFLAEALVRRGQQVVIASLTGADRTQVDWVNGVKVYYLRLRNLYWPFGDHDNPALLKPAWHTIDSYNPLMAKVIAHIMNEEQVDLINTNNLAGFSVAVWHAAKRRGIPVIHTIRDQYLLCPRGTMFRADSDCRRQCTDCKLFAGPRRRGAASVSGFIGVSRYILEKHRDFGYFSPSVPTTVVPNGYVAGSISNGRRQPANPTRLGYLGRLHPSKGIEYLLRAHSRLPQGSFDLWIGGSGTDTYVAQLRRTFPSGAIRFLGYVPASAFLTDIDVLIVPSLVQEAFSRVVLEAQAHGVPVIASNRGGIPELIQDGRTGLIFDPAEPDSLERAISALRSSPILIDQMRDRALESAKQFTPEHIAALNIEFFRHVLASS